MRTPTNLLGIWAHPDDEAYLSAGLMDRVVRSGGHVTVVALSDGEGGFGDDDTRPVAVKRGQRRAELQAAMAAIGVDDVRFGGRPDGSVALVDSDPVVAAIASTIDDVGPDVVVTFGPDGITGHDDHVACWSLATRAWRACPRGELWYAAKTVDWLDEWRDLHDRFSIWMTEEPTGVIGADIEYVIDLDGADLDRKREVLAGHRSQTAGVAEAIGEADYRRWIDQETFRRPAAHELHGRLVAASSVDERGVMST